MHVQRTYVSEPRHRVREHTREINPRLPQSLDRFVKILRTLNPESPQPVDVLWNTIDGRLTAFVMVGGVTIKILTDDTGDSEKFNQEVQDLLNTYRHGPVLWSGCRDQVAAYLKVRKNSSFNRWFDSMVHQLNERKIARSKQDIAAPSLAGLETAVDTFRALARWLNS